MLTSESGRGSGKGVRRHRMSTPEYSKYIFIPPGALIFFLSSPHSVSLPNSPHFLSSTLFFCIVPCAFLVVGWFFHLQEPPSVLVLCCHPTIIVLRSALSCVVTLLSLSSSLFLSLFFSFFFYLPSSHPPSILLSLTSILRDARLYLVSLLSLYSSLPSYSFPVGPCIVGLSVRSRHRHQPHRLLSSTDLTKNSTFLLRLCKAFFFAFFPSPSFGANKIQLNLFICNLIFSPLPHHPEYEKTSHYAIRSNTLGTCCYLSVPGLDPLAYCYVTGSFAIVTVIFLLTRRPIP